eukprot:15873685-Heterocapsa_arctica.AAC.1
MVSWDNTGTREDRVLLVAASKSAPTSSFPHRHNSRAEGNSSVLPVGGFDNPSPTCVEALPQWGATSSLVVA